MKPEREAKFAQILAGLLLAGAASAAEQVITPTPLQRAAAPDRPVAFAVGYSTANPCADHLTGLGLRLHWDSRRLALVSLTGALATAQVARGPVESDTTDADGDPATDKFVQVAWADIEGTWPGGGCAGVKLYTANFRTLTGLTGSTQIRFSASSTAAGYALGSVAAVVALDTDSDGIPDATDPDDDNDGVLDAADSAPRDANNKGAVIALPLKRPDRPTRLGLGRQGVQHHPRRNLYRRRHRPPAAFPGL